MILIISLFWSLGNIYNINTYLNFANFSTCKDFRMLYDRGYLDYFPEKEDYISSSIGEVKKLSDQVEVKISGYFVKYFKVEKIGEISKLEKIKNCLIPNFENKKVILIEEIDRRDPNFPELPNTNFAPLPTDSNFSTPTNPPIYLPPNIAN